MICKNCGEFLEDNAKFCTSCGARLEAETQVAVSEPVRTYEEPPAQEEIPVYEGHVVGGSEPVSFLEAVKLAFRHYADFKGRARRSEYWWFTLFNTIAGGILGAVIPDFSWIWSLVVLVPTLSLIVRRLHDAGKSGWFYLWMLLPFIGYIIVLIQLLKDSAPDNRWGPNPKN